MSVLSDEKVVQELKKSLKEYFQINDNGEVHSVGGRKSSHKRENNRNNIQIEKRLIGTAKKVRKQNQRVRIRSLKNI